MAEGLSVPRHIAVIMDGNGRWAKARGLPRSAGHQAGTEPAPGHPLRQTLAWNTSHTLFQRKTGSGQSEVDLLLLLASYIDNETQALHARARLLLLDRKAWGGTGGQGCRD